MFVIFQSGGTQHKAELGSLLSLQKLDLKVGEEVRFNQVCLVSKDDGKLEVGAPWLKGIEVIGEVVRQYKEKKIRIVKFRRRKNSIRTKGHRQPMTQVRIRSINV